MREIPLYLILILGLVSTAVHGTTYVVSPDGTGDFPTIQAAINATASGDTVELADGTFLGDGNRDIHFFGKAITVGSQSADPENCIIDCQGTATEWHRGFTFRFGEGPESVLEGIAITNGCMDGNAWIDFSGGAILIYENSSPTIRNCSFIGNFAKYGGAIRSHGGGSSPTIRDCVFYSNQTSDQAGAVYIFGNSGLEILDCFFYQNSSYFGGAISGSFYDPLIDMCTFVENTADLGGAIYAINTSTPLIRNCTLYRNAAVQEGSGLHCQSENAFPTLENTIIAFNAGGAAVSCSGGSNVTLTCCDLYANEHGDWVGCIADQLGINGNIAMNPLFCDVENGDWTLHENSPCAPFSAPNVECDLIGAWPVACGPAPPPAVRHVPSEYPTIQAAIDVSVHEDTVRVAPGTYMGPGNVNLDFGGRNLVLLSVAGPESTVIDCNGSARGFHFHEGESQLALVQGFTIRNGSAVGSLGAGVLCEDASPTFRECVLLENTVQLGSGGAFAFLGNSKGTVEDCDISGNSASTQGGGVYCDASSPWIRDCSVTENEAEEGGGLGCYAHWTSFPLGAAPVVEGCVISGNSGVNGGGVSCTERGEPQMISCVVSGNLATNGGGVYCMTSGDVGTPHPRFTGCTFAGNKAQGLGGALFVGDGMRAYGYNSIYWGNCASEGGEEIYATGPMAGIKLTCCAWDSSGILDFGGWGVIGSGPQVFTNPLFCGPEFCGHAPTMEGDYTLADISPCLPENSPCGELIGALGVGCSSSSVPEDSVSIAQPVFLSGPKPNPSNGLVVFDLNLARAERVRIGVYDVRGRLVERLVDGVLNNGRHSIVWEAPRRGSAVGSGVYYVRVRSGSQDMTRKVIVIQ